MPANADGIAFMDTFFARRDRNSRSMHGHELSPYPSVERQGADNFLLAYGIGFAQFGYWHSPLDVAQLPAGRSNGIH